MRRLAVVLLVACGGGAKPAPPPPEERFEGDFTPAPAEAAEVVAEVNGEQIYVADVERHARERGLDARAALDELVAFELLAQEARARGLTDDREVVAARKQARVRRLLGRAFLPTFDTPDDVPQADIDLVLQNPIAKAHFFHEPYHRVVNALVRVRRVDDPEAKRQIAVTLYRRLLAERPPDKETFARRAAEIGAELGEEVRTEEVDIPRSSEGYDRAFGLAAWAIDEVGAITPPVRTGYGWHVIYLWGFIPEKTATTAEIQGEIFPEMQKRAFVRWVDELVARRRITRDESWLERIEAAPPSLLPGR